MKDVSSSHIGARANEYPWPWYPAKPEDFEISQSDWEAYCRDMEQMRREYERLVFGEVS